MRNPPPSSSPPLASASPGRSSAAPAPALENLRTTFPGASRISSVMSPAGARRPGSNRSSRPGAGYGNAARRVHRARAVRMPSRGLKRNAAEVRHLIVQLMQRRQVVENPEAAALRREHQILVRHLDVGDRRDGQVQLEGLPVRAVVERDVHAELGAGVEQAGAIGIFAHDARRLIGRDAVLAVGQLRPGLAEIVGAIDVRREIAQQESIDRHVRGPRSVRARLDVLHAAARRQVLRRHVGPRLAVVARHVDQAVVRSGPDQALLQRSIRESRRACCRPLRRWRRA